MFEKEKLGVGRDNAKKYLEEHSEMAKKIKKELKDQESEKTNDQKISQKQTGDQDLIKYR